MQRVFSVDITVCRELCIQRVDYVESRVQRDYGIVQDKSYILYDVWFKIGCK